MRSHFLLTKPPDSNWFVLDKYNSTPRCPTIHWANKWLVQRLFVPLSHWYSSTTLEPRCCAPLWSYDRLVLRPSCPTVYLSYQSESICFTAHWCNASWDVYSIIICLTNPTTHRANDWLIQRPICHRAQWFCDPLVIHLKGPTRWEYLSVHPTGHAIHCSGHSLFMHHIGPIPKRSHRLELRWCKAHWSYEPLVLRPNILTVPLGLTNQSRTPHCAYYPMAPRLFFRTLVCPKPYEWGLRCDITRFNCYQY